MRQARQTGKGRTRSKDERDPKRLKSSIIYYMQRQGSEEQVPIGAAADSRESSEEPAGMLTDTPALPPVPGLQRAVAQGLATCASGGAKVQTGLLQSLQRRFVQQALSTPAITASASAQQVWPGEHQEGGGAQEEDLDGFVLHSQPTYERTLSQRFGADLEDGTELQPSGSAEESQTRFEFDVGGGQGEPSQAVVGGCSAAVRCNPGAAVPDPEDLRRRLSNTSNASHRTTPGLSAEERVAAAAVVVGAAGGRCSTAQLFPIFRSRKDMKQLYIIRHGESQYNAESAKASSQGGSWADPWIFDAPLTERGCAQARALRGKLAALRLPADTLWVTSPLQRAMQTLMLCCPVMHLLGRASGADGAGGSDGESAECGVGCSRSSSGSSAASTSNQEGQRAPMLAVRHEISERVFTTGDIGHPPDILRRRFPQLATELGHLPEVWWYSNPAKVNCAVTERFELHEPSDHVKVRIGEFRKWLLSRPEKVVVAVGHSSYWSEFWKLHEGSKPDKMRNCELLGPIWV